ncbi:MAG: acetate/propionate family kinase [Gemmatimonadaceae bacterium]|nr:acetate/propionate family kinase [Gemmatimonadaceae bacterium]
MLALNTGSSSVKAALYDVTELTEQGSTPPKPLWLGEQQADEPVEDLVRSLTRGDMPALRGLDAIDIVGHRIVHGGATLVESVRVTADVRSTIERASEHAPDHNARALHALDEVSRLLGARVPQVAVFDTAFHVTLPPAAYTYAGPFEWLARGIRRFGFHGISHRYAAYRAAHLLQRDVGALRVVTCHLGGGCSLAAVLDGRSVETTMGFTPLDGVVMSRRSGAIDPGILIHLLRHEGHTADSLDRLLNHDSGLAGLSGTSGDMRDVLSAMDSGDERARLALDVYVHHIRQAIAAMAASMNGLDALVFTGGVGEHAPRVRALVCEGLAFLGIALDSAINARIMSDAVCSANDAKVAVLVVHAEENWAVAQECLKVVSHESVR